MYNDKPCIHQTADVWVQLLAPVQKNPVPRASWLKAVRTNDGARDHPIANAVMYNMPKYLYCFFESVWDVWRIWNKRKSQTSSR